MDKCLFENNELIFGDLVQDHIFASARRLNESLNSLLPEQTRVKRTSTMASFTGRNSASSREGSLFRSGSGVSSVSGVSRGSKKIDDAKHLSRATTQATLAAKTILSAGGSEDAALQTAKAAAQATLLQSHIGVAAFTGSKGGPSAFLCRRKIKRQSDVVASMALVSASNDLFGVSSYDPLSGNGDPGIKTMSINVNQNTSNGGKPSPLTATPHPPLPTVLSSGNDVKANKTKSFFSTSSKGSRLSMGSHTSKKQECTLSTPKASNTPAETSEHAAKVMSKSLATGELPAEDPDKKIELTSTGSLSKPLEKGSLSLDSNDIGSMSKPVDKGSLSLDSNEKVELIKEDSDSEVKENSAPKEGPSPIVTSSSKEAGASLKLIVPSPKPMEPSEVVSPMNSVMVNLLRKKSQTKSILTPAGNYFIQNPVLRDGLQKKFKASSPVIKTPSTSPNRDVRINVLSPQSGMDEYDDSDPVYTVNRRHRGHRERDDALSERLDLGISSSSSDDDSSSLFTTDTYRTNQTFMTTNVDPFFSIFTNMLKCGTGTNNPGGESVKAKKNCVKGNFKSSRIVFTTASSDSEDKNDFGNIIRSPHERKQRADSDASTMVPRVQNAGSGRFRGRRTGQKEARNPLPEGRDEVDEPRDTVELVETNTGTYSDVYNSTFSRSSEATPPEVPNQRSRDQDKKGRWRKALGLKPTKPKRRPMVME